jgi:hypothetical protein
MKSSNETIENRSRDLPVCSAVPQPLCHHGKAEVNNRICLRNLRPRVFCAPYILRDDFGFIFAPCISRTIVFFIYWSSHYLLHKNILNTVFQHCCLSLKIRCCSWGNCEQDCTVIYRKYFSCFSTIVVFIFVKISRWERRIIVIQHRTK